MMAWLNVVLGGVFAALGLAMVAGHLRPGEDWSARATVAAERVLGQDHRATRRMRKVHDRNPAVRRRLGWVMFWVSLPPFVGGLLHLLWTALS